MYRDFELTENSILSAHNVDTGGLVEYGQYYLGKDVWAQYATSQRAGSVFTGAMAMPDSEFLKHEFYNDFLKRFDTRYACGIVTQQDNTAFSSMGLYRSHSQDDFRESELEKVKRLLPHLTRSVHIYTKLNRLEDLSRGLLAASEMSRDAVFLLDGECRIEHANSRASFLLNHRDGISDDQNILRLHDNLANTHLKTTIAHISIAQGSASPYAGEQLISQRTDGRRPFHLLIAPLRSNVIQDQLTTARGFAKCIVFITDLDDLPAPSENTLHDLFHLTNAEARLAARLGAGDSLKEACDALRITKETGRTVVKRIFQKTDTNRQAELVRLVSSTARNNGPVV